MIGDSRLLARAGRRAVRADHADVPLARAARADPAAVEWRIEFCQPIDLSEYGPDAAEDRRARLRPLRAGARDDPGRRSTRTS